MSRDGGTEGETSQQKNKTYFEREILPPRALYSLPQSVPCSASELAGHERA